MSGAQTTGYVVDVHGADKRNATFRWCGNAIGEDEALLCARRAVRISWAAAAAATGSAGRAFPEELGLGEKVVKRPGWTIDLQWHPKEAILKAMRALRPDAPAIALGIPELSQMIASIAMGDPEIGARIGTGEQDAIVRIDVKGTGRPPHLMLLAKYDEGRQPGAHPSHATAEALLALGTMAAIHDAQGHERLAEKRVGAPKSAILRATLARDADATRRDLVAPACALLRRIGEEKISVALELQSK